MSYNSFDDCDRYLQNKNISELSKKNYLLELERLSLWTQNHDPESDLLHLSPEVLQKYIRHLASHLKASTVSRKLMMIRTFFKFTNQDDLLQVIRSERANLFSSEPEPEIEKRWDNRDDYQGFLSQKGITSIQRAGFKLTCKS